MRMLVMLLLGLAIGAFAAVTAVSAMRQETPLSRGVMAVSGHHFGALRRQVEAGTCPADAAADRFARLRLLADDIESGLRPSGDDARLERLAAEYRAALDRARAAALPDCAALAPQLDAVARQCRACHDVFR